MNIHFLYSSFMVAMSSFDLGQSISIRTLSSVPLKTYNNNITSAKDRQKNKFDGCNISAYAVSALMIDW